MFHQPPPPVNEGFGAIEGLGLNIVSSDRKLESDFRDFAKDPVLITRSEQVSSNLLNLFCLKYCIIISTSFEFDFVQRIVIFLYLFFGINHFLWSIVNLLGVVIACFTINPVFGYCL